VTLKRKLLVLALVAGVVVSVGAKRFYAWTAVCHITTADIRP
jgi:hypothetical protein